MLKIKRGILDADIKAAGGGVAVVAPSRPSKANKPFRAQFDAAREAWRKHVPERWASKTSFNHRQNMPDVSDAQRQSTTITPYLRVDGNYVLTDYCHDARYGAIITPLLRSLTDAKNPRRGYVPGGDYGFNILRN